MIIAGFISGLVSVVLQKLYTAFLGNIVWQTLAYIYNKWRCEFYKIKTKKIAMLNLMLFERLKKQLINLIL